MLSMDELLQGKDLASLPEGHQENLAVLLDRINKIRSAYGIPMTVTSGYRSMADHLRIYAAKGITDPAKIPMKSKHLYGQAVDIADSDGALKKWVLANLKLLEDIGLWCEDFSTTTTWVHFQIVPPGSGKRIFMP